MMFVQIKAVHLQHFSTENIRNASQVIFVSK